MATMPSVGLPDADLVCLLCGQYESFYCRDSTTGELRPMCVEKCGEHESVDGRCRDCGIQHHLDTMQCSVCERMRYRARDGTVMDKFTAIGEALWGERCTCDPKPPSVADVKATAPV